LLSKEKLLFYAKW